jgi:hypothetical protein
VWWLSLYLLALSASAQQVIGVIGGAGITGVVAWLIARRGSSGSVSTSDAATLWGAAEAIRREQGDEIVRLRERIAVLEDQRKDDRARIVALEDEVRGRHS